MEEDEGESYEIKTSKICKQPNCACIGSRVHYTAFAKMEGDYVSETQQKMGSLIAKPKMTEKYLKKPPFRFLHDIVLPLSLFLLSAARLAREENEGGRGN